MIKEMYVDGQVTEEGCVMGKVGQAMRKMGQATGNVNLVSGVSMT